MAEKFRYYVPFLAYALGEDRGFMFPGHDYYDSDAAVETEEQIEAMRKALKARMIISKPEYITLLDWKRIQ